MERAWSILGGGAVLALSVPLALGAARLGVPPVEAAEIVRAYPHDRGAFTQGLLYREGRLYESTGLFGRSTVREVRLDDGRVLRQATVPGEFFGEGLADRGDRLLSLTWLNGRGFIWDRTTFKQVGEWRYPGQGWGLTYSGTEFVMSDGTPELRFIDPKTMTERRRVTVTAEGRPLADLNELEWVKGEVFANVWKTDRIARIDPATGRVKAWIDLAAIVRGVPGRGPEDVLNGIAWDAKGKRLFVTGKHWPVLYQVRVRGL